MGNSHVPKPVYHSQYTKNMESFKVSVVQRYSEGKTAIDEMNSEKAKKKIYF